MRGRADAGKVEVDAAPAQAVRGVCLHEAVLDGDLRAHALQAFEVVVHGPRADVAATGEGDARPAEAGKQRAEHGERGPHLLDQLVGGFKRCQRGGVDGDGPVLREARPDAQMPQQVQQGQDVADAGDIGQDGLAVLGEHGGGEDREGGVLAAAQSHVAREASSAHGLYFLQRRVLLRGRGRRRLMFWKRRGAMPAPRSPVFVITSVQYTRLGADCQARHKG